MESPIKNSEKLEIETVPTFRQNEDENDNNSTTPKKQTEIEIDNNFVKRFLSDKMTNIAK